MSPILSIIIVNYNGKGFLDDCLESIDAQVSCSHEIIIVDNASMDGSADYIRQHYPAVTLIAHPENSGFSIGNNIGARTAKGRYLLLLNNDTRLLTDVVPGIALMESRPDIGAVGAKMLGRSNEYRFSAGYFPSPWRIIKISSMYRKDGPFRDGFFESLSDSSSGYIVDWIEGSFLLTRADLWRRLGGLDEGSFMYGEDVDFCRRMKISGFICMYQPSMQFVHYGGYGTGRLPLITKGFLRYHERHSGPALQGLIWLILVIKLMAINSLHTLQFLLTRAPAFQEKARASKQALYVALGRL